MVTHHESRERGATDLALAFTNTIERSRRGARDALASTHGTVTWLDEAGLLEEAGRREALRSAPVARVTRQEALRLRDAVRQLLAARSAGTPPTSGTLYAINRVLEQGARTTALRLDEGRLELRDHQQGDGTFALLAPVALAAARLVTTVDPARLRCCAADDCRSWFVDTSKGGRRRWCSMASCGNRAKATRHRRRQSDSA